MSEFEVVRSKVDGWDVRRVGESVALSNHADRADAEAAATIEQGLEHEAGDADAIDVRQDVFSDTPEEAVDVKKTGIGLGLTMVGIIVLIAVIGAIVALTDFGG